MTEEALRTPEEATNTGVDSGVVEGQPTIPEGYVSQDDLNALRSSLDKQVSALTAQNQQMAVENEQLRNQRRDADLENLPEEERYKYLYEEERQRREQAEEAQRIHAAKAEYAQNLATEFGIPAYQLMAYEDPGSMMRAARDFYVSQVQVQQTIQPSPTATPAPAGATLQQRQPELTPEQLRAEALSSRDEDAFIASFTRK